MVVSSSSFMPACLIFDNQGPKINTSRKVAVLKLTLSSRYFDKPNRGFGALLVIRQGR